MNNPYSESTGEADVHSVGSAIREIRSGLIGLIKSDIELAKAEMGEAVGHVKKGGSSLAIFAGVALVGVPPFLAFLVIGLGELIGNFWLSALIVSVACFVVGAVGMSAAIKTLKRADLKLSHTRNVMGEGVSSANRKVQQVVEQNRGHLSAAQGTAKTAFGDLKSTVMDIKNVATRPAEAHAVEAGAGTDQGIDRGSNVMDIKRAQDAREGRAA